MGVITLHNIPAKVIKINEIEENPKPGTSYIGQKYLIVEVGEIPEVMANWTVVKVSYVEYPEPKTIEYELFSEKRKIKVKYHSVGFEITGDLSVYMKE
ncbi:MAG: hypothetical protein GTN99_02655 [Candidatus Dadabacteria bacterium]|nr:hypothetical protein [Candidatus Dadabacteria bacterium]NIT13166.1 hypothetical protein [Candidatus Dadabacteria bacterium]